MFMRFTSALCVSLFLIGCAQPRPSEEEVWQAVEGCEGKELCSKATVAALTFNKQAGRDFGGGVKLRGAETDGRILSVDIDLPAAVVDEPVRNGRSIKQQIDDALKKGLCRRDLDRFFSLGGEIRALTYLPSGEQFSETSIKSC